MNSLQPPGLEHRAIAIPPLRAFGALLVPIAGLLPVMFVLSLAGGLGLRQLSSQADPAGLMAVLGALCWLVGSSLADPLQQVLLRLDRHRRRPVRQLATRARLFLATLLAATALALAMLPVHFAYDQAQELFSVQTLKPPDLVFRSSYLLLLLHIAVAPPFILLSGGLLRLLRLRLPAHFAAALWLATGILLTVVPASLNTISNIPLSLGQFSGWILEFMYANKKLASPYIQELLREVVMRLILVWVAGLAVMWSSLLPAARPWQRVRPLWLACCAALLTAGLRSLALTLRWTREVLPLSPVDWWSVLLCGLAALWLVWLVSAITTDRQRLLHSFRRDSGWLLLLPAGLLVLTIPCLQAGDADHLVILSGMLLVLPVLLLGLLLPIQLSMIRHAILRNTGYILLGGLLLLPLPQESLLFAMLRSMRSGFGLPLPETEQLQVWLCLLATLPLAWPGLLDRLRSMLPPAKRLDRQRAG